MNAECPDSLLHNTHGSYLLSSKLTARNPKLSMENCWQQIYDVPEASEANCIMGQREAGRRRSTYLSHVAVANSSVCFEWRRHTSHGVYTSLSTTQHQQQQQLVSGEAANDNSQSTVNCIYMALSRYIS